MEYKEPYDKNINVRVGDSHKELIELMRAKSGQSTGYIVRKSIELYYENNKRTN